MMDGMQDGMGKAKVRKKEGKKCQDPQYRGLGAGIHPSHPVLVGLVWPRVHGDFRRVEGASLCCLRLVQVRMVR